MERGRTFLSPCGTQGMKYWVCQAPPDPPIWLKGSLSPAEIPMEIMGIEAPVQPPLG